METVQKLVDNAAEISFANSEVRDNKGILLKVYHGTDSENFNVFDKSRRGQTDSGVWGRGYYFLSDYDYASDFGENVRSFYLNVETPFYVSKVSASAKEIGDYLKSHGIDVNFDYSNMQAHEFVNYFGNQRFTDVMTDLGYDGVIIDDFEYLVFNQNQMKLTDPVTYDKNGNIIPLSERFKDSNKDIRYSLSDEFSDLSSLDDEKIKVYNNRIWAYGLFTDEDILLLNERYNELRTNKRTDNVLGDGSRLVEVNNKMVIIGGTFNEPEIYCVVAINAPDETEAEIYKEVMINEKQNYGNNRYQYTDCLRNASMYFGKKIIRIYEASNFVYHKGQKDTGERAVLPSNFQNYGYTSKFNNRNGNSGKAEQGVFDEQIKNIRFSLTEPGEITDVDIVDLFEDSEEAFDYDFTTYNIKLSHETKEAIKDTIKTLVELNTLTQNKRISDKDLRNLCKR